MSAEQVTLRAFLPRDVIVVFELMAAYAARTAYHEVGYDADATILGLASIAKTNPGLVYRAVAENDSGEIVAFLLGERLRPWFSPGSSYVLEQFFALKPNVSAGVTLALLSDFEEWAFSDPNTVGVNFCSMPSFGRESAVTRFMETRGYRHAEQAWFLSRAAREAVKPAPTAAN
jgi:hypothetical protein